MVILNLKLELDVSHSLNDLLDIIKLAHEVQCEALIRECVIMIIVRMEKPQPSEMYKLFLLANQLELLDLREFCRVTAINDIGCLFSLSRDKNVNAEIKNICGGNQVISEPEMKYFLIYNLAEDDSVSRNVLKCT